MKKKPVSLFEFLDSYKPEELWPLNLLKVLFIEIPLYNPNALVETIRTSLTERECDVIFKYYHDGMTYDEIAKKYDRTRERIRQIHNKALRKLKHKSRYEKYLLYDYEYVARLKSELEETKAAAMHLHEKLNYIPESVRNEVEESTKEIGWLKDLDVRSYNALCRYAKSRYGQDRLYIWQLTEMTLEEVMSIRNIGKGSVKNILLSLKNYGGLQLKDCSYDDYIIEEEIDESRKVL